MCWFWINFFKIEIWKNVSRKEFGQKKYLTKKKMLIFFFFITFPRRVQLQTSIIRPLSSRCSCRLLSSGPSHPGVAVGSHTCRREVRSEASNTLVSKLKQPELSSLKYINKIKTIPWCLKFYIKYYMPFKIQNMMSLICFHRTFNAWLSALSTVRPCWARSVQSVPTALGGRGLTRPFGWKQS